MNPLNPRKYLYMLALIFLLAAAGIQLKTICMTCGRVMNLKKQAGTSEWFRRQQLSEESLKKLKEVSQQTGLSVGELLAAWMPAGHFRLLDGEDLTSNSYFKWDACFLRYRLEEYRELKGLYQAIWDDLKYFPVSTKVTYEDSWMFERNYRGKRGHEGTDLMPPENKSGSYPVFSMTDGVIEKIGWLEIGGYRMGIRSPHGGYFYYAHLSGYAEDFQEGEAIQAGDMIGFMGDTGYGTEGTRGRFDVHLHLGIYVRTKEKPEVSVNPYWILKSLEGQKLKYRYQM